MQNKSLIIHLIQQDLKHNQLVHGLSNTGLTTDLHHLSLFETVAQLMEIPFHQLSDPWTDLYFAYLEKASEYEITETGENLKELARACYAALIRSY